MKPRVLVLGTVNRDRLLLSAPGGGTECRSAPGGVVYSLLALAVLHPWVDIRARVLAGCDSRNELETLLTGCGIAPGELFLRDAPTNTVELDCRHPGSKRERSTLLLGGYRKDECPLEPVEGVLVNFTSGREFRFDCWQHWKRTLLHTSPGVHLQVDLHSLSLDACAGRPRRLRPLARWRDWLGQVGLLQLTLQECACLPPHRPRALEETGSLLHELYGLGIREVVITDGSRGFLYSTPEDTRILGALPARVLDTTGCGDVLGAALFGSGLAGWPLGMRLEHARSAATFKLGFSGVTGLAGLRDFQTDRAHESAFPPPAL